LHVTVIVRDALPEELTRVGDLRVTAYRADGFLAEPPASAYADTLRALGADGQGEILVAADGPTLLGTVMLQFSAHGGEVLRRPDEAEIRALAVAPGARGRGIGRALLAAVMERAGERGIRYLVLLTQPEMQAARSLYTRAGFERLPVRDWSPGPGITLLAYGRPLDGA
jgi:ribosomal protein S18 acetylase RimI-like enzyme